MRCTTYTSGSNEGFAVSEHRRRATLAGALYLVTHITSVTSLALLQSSAATSPGVADQATLRVVALLELALALSVVGTAVCLRPIVGAFSPASASAYVALRTLEASVIALGVVALLASLAVAGEPGGGADASTLLAVQQATFLVGPGLVVPFHTVALAATLLRHRAAPRFIAWLGVAGGPIVLASNLAVLFELQPQVSPVAALAAIPVFAWEVSLAVWLIARGPRTVASSAPRRGLDEGTTSDDGVVGATRGAEVR